MVAGLGRSGNGPDPVIVAPRRMEIPCSREFSRSGASLCRFPLFRTETCGSFPAPRAGKPADPNSDFSNAEQGINTAHCRTSSLVNHGAACNAIAAIFAAFKQADIQDAGSP